MHKYEKQSGRKIAITGMRQDEGGERSRIKGCILTKNGSIYRFHPLLVVPDEWKDWFLEKYNIKLCRLYYPPFNFKRTGCKGCPFSLNLQDQLEVMGELLPAERIQCENLWKPVYTEYRRIGYRLKDTEQIKLF